MALFKPTARLSVVCVCVCVQLARRQVKGQRVTTVMLNCVLRGLALTGAIDATSEGPSPTELFPAFRCSCPVFHRSVGCLKAA